MRENKFKIWDKTRNKMLTSNCGAFLLTQEGNAVFHQNGNNPLEALIEQIDYEVLMYTGLKDKNGTEIYEGDIIRTHENRIQKVIWHNNGFKLEYKFKRSYRGESYWETRKDIELSETNNKRWGIKVIGNIYENPELLKEGE
ncbi:YopX family protein [Clostridium sp.]|uniref:YopX family protein n=1 Tax=Clostridium sp. TaxID=1506 RepID=UPI00290849D4|nr:YopX family protein [Clostridium sp.]MDU4728109.1 YopX family protein [Clostridium sp.]